MALLIDWNLNLCKLCQTFGILMDHTFEYLPVTLFNALIRF